MNEQLALPTIDSVPFDLARIVRNIIQETQIRFG